jgi:NB-ARC domain
MTNVALKMPLPSSVSFTRSKNDCTRRQSIPNRARQKPQNNHIPPRSRERGVILTLHGWHKLQAAKSEAEFQENAGDRFTLEELNERTELSLNTISKVLGRLESVDRSSLQMVFGSFGLVLEKSDYSRPNSPLKGLDIRQNHPNQDWGEAVDVSLFYGRKQELITLQQWVLEEHCRIVAVLGIGGIGKSTLAVKLASQIEQEFEIVVWRSLQNAPSLEDLLESILLFLLNNQEEDSLLPTSLDQKIAKFLDCLRSSRCLLILDNMETILASGSQSGKCREGYESYCQLLQYIGTIPHQSCVILTSREKHRQIALLEGETLPVRSLKLGALKPTEGQKLFEQKGQFIGSQTKWNRLIEHYGGNPLALKLVATTTQELFNGRIAEVLKYVEQGLLVFDGIRNVLDLQFNRLSHLEQEVMFWLAINQEAIDLDELRENLISSVAKRELPGTLNSLLRRSLIEKIEPRLIESTKSELNEQNMTQFSLQPLVMKYVLERLIRQVCDEIEQQQIGLLITHCLFKAETSDRFGKEKKLILQPIAEWLLTEAKNPQETEQWLQELLEQQRQSPRLSGYTISNLQNLLMYYKQKHCCFEHRLQDFSI